MPLGGVTIAMNRLFAALDRWTTLPDSRRRVLVWVLCGLFALNATFAALLNSGACDELAAHIPGGWLYLKSGEFSGGIDNFPLGQILIALPAAISGVSYTLWTEQHLFLFRLPVILMGLLTCLLTWRLGSRIFGEAAGLVALLFAAFCPNLLAHATLATLDLPTAFFVLLTLYLLDRYLERPDGRRMALLSLALAAATLIKIQALLLVPLVYGVLLLHLPRILRGESAWRSGPARPPAGADRSPAGGRPAGSVRLARLLPWVLLPVAWFVLVHLVYLHPPLRGGALLPPLYLEAFAGLREHNVQGHWGYLLGNYSTQGWWYFFPVAIAVKTPIVTLLLLAAGLVGARSRRALLLVTVPIVLFLAGAMASRINIGLRHVLMLYPFFAMAAGVGAVRIWNGGGTASIPWGRPLVAALVASYLVHAAFITPHHLSYFNLFAGGARNGHRVLVDSNYDWGTNDRFLRADLARSDRKVQINPYAFRPTSGEVIVNANALYGVLNGGEQAYAWLKELRPTRRIATTWFVYEVPSSVGSGQAEDREATTQVVAHLARVRTEFPRVGHPGFGTVLGRAFAEARAYDLAFETLRRTLAESPAYAPALHLGGELMTRWKLGILVFHGREYLDGVRTPPSDLAAGRDLDRTIAMARRSGRAVGLGRVHAELGLVLAEMGDGVRAGEQLRTALRFDPENREARALLERGDTRVGP